MYDVPSNEHERAIASLHQQARRLQCHEFHELPLTAAARAAALPPPRFVFLLDDGRALAWLGEDRPYLVHPSFEDLCAMHGLLAAVVKAA